MAIAREGLALLHTLEVIDLHLLRGQLAVLDTGDGHVSTAIFTEGKE